jgi:hypothetical protein
MPLLVTHNATSLLKKGNKKATKNGCHHALQLYLIAFSRFEPIKKHPLGC